MKNRHLLAAVAICSLVATFLSLGILLLQSAHEREIESLTRRIEELEARPREPRTLKEAFQALEDFFEDS